MNTPVHTIYRCEQCHDMHPLPVVAKAGSWVICPITGILVQIHTPVAVAA